MRLLLPLALGACAGPTPDLALAEGRVDTPAQPRTPFVALDTGDVDLYDPRGPEVVTLSNPSFEIPARGAATGNPGTLVDLRPDGWSVGGRAWAEVATASDDLKGAAGDQVLALVVDGHGAVGLVRTHSGTAIVAGRVYTLSAALGHDVPEADAPKAWLELYADGEVVAQAIVTVGGRDRLTTSSLVWTADERHGGRTLGVGIGAASHRGSGGTVLLADDVRVVGR